MKTPILFAVCLLHPMKYLHWLALKAVPSVGNVTFRRLVDRFGSPENVFSASPAELNSFKGVHPGIVKSISSGEALADAEKECKAVALAGVQIVTFLSAHYPKALLQVPDYPPFLYIKGSLKSEEYAIAIVGSRRASPYGLSTAEKLASDLAAHGVAVVSGMARGIDTAAHRGTIKEGGRSIGVLGCGIDVIYPWENRQLFSEITKNGALVSEFPMGTAPRAENFPRRNRIISGLSKGVVVVEAAEKSGSLITADYALEQGREVFAVPGSINHGFSRGSNRLIKQGAKLVEGVEDILEELPWRSDIKQAKQEPFLRPEEAEVYCLLADNPVHIDEIISKSALTAGEVSAILLRLELAGAVIQFQGMYFAQA